MFLSLVALFGCPGEPEPPEPPSLLMLAPTEGSAIAVTDVAVSFVVEHFALLDPDQAALTPAAAPWPLWLLPTASAHGSEDEPEGYAAIRLDGVELDQIGTTQYTIPTVEAGSHTLEIELVWEDGDPLDPAVLDAVTFEALAP